MTFKKKGEIKKKPKKKVIEEEEEYEEEEEEEEEEFETDDGGFTVSGPDAAWRLADPPGTGAFSGTRAWTTVPDCRGTT